MLHYENLYPWCPLEDLCWVLIVIQRWLLSKRYGPWYHAMLYLSITRLNSFSFFHLRYPFDEYLDFESIGASFSGELTSDYSETGSFPDLQFRVSYVLPFDHVEHVSWFLLFWLAVQSLRRHRRSPFKAVLEGAGVYEVSKFDMAKRADM